MSYIDPYRLKYRSKLGHVVRCNVSKRQIKFPTGEANNRDWKELWRSGNLLLDIRGKMVYLVGGYSSYDSRTEKWHPKKNPHFYGLDREEAPLLGHFLNLDKIEYAA